MYRQSLVNAVRPALRTTFQSRAAFSTTTRAMAEGDTGAPSSGGALGDDAFKKREKAGEDYAIHQREQSKLLELRKKLAEQQEHLKKLSDHLDELSKNSGGEQK